jgi:hypothetical protein
VLNRIQVPTEIMFLVVFWCLRYKLSLRDLAEMFLIRGVVFTHEAVRDWEAKPSQAGAGPGGVYRGPDMRHPAELVQAAKRSSVTDD